MLKNYFKQAWTLMRQNCLFTGIYVVGTGLSIALVMTLFIIFYVKFGPVYPEYNRDRTLVLKPIKRYPKDKPESWRCGLLCRGPDAAGVASCGAGGGQCD